MQLNIALDGCSDSVRNSVAENIEVDIIVLRECEFGLLDILNEAIGGVVWFSLAGLQHHAGSIDVLIDFPRGRQSPNVPQAEHYHAVH